MYIPDDGLSGFSRSAAGVVALYSAGIYDDVWQCPTVLAPLHMGDASGETVILRPVHSARAMTATPVQLPAELLEGMVDAILALEGVGAVALDVTSKPPGTIEWE